VRGREERPKRGQQRQGQAQVQVPGGQVVGARLVDKVADRQVERQEGGGGAGLQGGERDGEEGGEDAPAGVGCGVWGGGWGVGGWTNGGVVARACYEWAREQAPSSALSKQVSNTQQHLQFSASVQLTGRTPSLLWPSRAPPWRRCPWPAPSAPRPGTRRSRSHSQPGGAKWG